MKTVIRIKFVVLFTVLLWSAAFLLHSDYFQDSLYKFILWIEWPIFSVGLLVSLVNHSISERGIQVCFLCLTVRTIPWEKVKHAIYVHTWRDPRTRYHWGPVHGQIIYVTLKGGTRFWPELDIRIFHKLRHPFSTVCLWLPDKKVRLFTEAFEHFYPDLERQTQQSGQNLEYTYRNRHY